LKRIVAGKETYFITFIQERLGWTQDLIGRIQQKRLQYFGHVIQMQQQRFFKLALHCVSKKTSPTFSTVTWKPMVRF